MMHSHMVSFTDKFTFGCDLICKDHDILQIESLMVAHQDLLLHNV